MAAATKEIVLVTGGNQGIGFELVHLLLKDHGDRFHLIIGSRSASNGQKAVERLQREGLQGVEYIQLDINSGESLAAAARSVDEKFGRLDVLHANACLPIRQAGISPETAHPEKSFKEHIMMAMETNAAAQADTVEHFKPLLEKADNPRLIFMSSGAGSATIALEKVVTVKITPAYGMSKAALNMLMIYYHHMYPRWKVNASNPGFRATQINNFGAGFPTPGPTSEGALNAVRLTLLDEDGESGRHTMMEGDEVQTLPW